VAADRVTRTNTGVLEDQEVAALAMRGQVVLALRGREMTAAVEETTVLAAAVAQELVEEMVAPLLVVMAVLECQIV
jgi:hypothetical protein